MNNALLSYKKGKSATHKLPLKENTCPNIMKQDKTPESPSVSKIHSKRSEATDCIFRLCRLTSAITTISASVSQIIWLHFQVSMCPLITMTDTDLSPLASYIFLFSFLLIPLSCVMVYHHLYVE